MLDEFLLHWADNADPWHRISCCDKPVFVFVEFCQVYYFFFKFKNCFYFYYFKL